MPGISETGDQHFAPRVAPWVQRTCPSNTSSAVLFCESTEQGWVGGFLGGGGHVRGGGVRVSAVERRGVVT